MREEDEVWSIDPLPISKNHHPRRNDDDFSCDFKIPFQDSKSNEIKLKGNNLRSTDELSAWADSLSREQLTSFLKLMKSKQGNWNNILPKEPSFDLSVNLERGGNNVVGRNRKEGGESEDDLLSLDLPSENSSSHSPPSKRKKSGKISTRSSSFHHTIHDDNSDKIELSMNTSPPISSRRKTREKKGEKEKNNKGETSQKKHKLLDRFKSSSHQYDLTKSSLLRCSFQNQSLKLDHEKEKKLEDLSAINDKINEYQLNEYVKGIKSVKSATSDIIEQVVEKVLEDEELRNYIGNQLYLPEDRNGRKKFLSQVLMDPSTSNMRPFLSDQRIKDILQNKRTKEGLIPCLILQDGDPVHIPFTENEKNLVSKIEEKIKLDDSEEVIEMMAQIIPGRNLEDCKRYYLGKLKGELNGFTFTEEKVILYKRPEKMETDSPRGLFELTRQLRTFSHKHKNPIAMQRIGRNSVFKQFKSISSSTLASGQIVDCKFHPSQYKVATASTDTPYEAVLYDLKTGRAIALEGHGNTVGDIHFSNDGEYIITGSYDKTVRTWSSETGKACFVMKKSDDSPGHGDGVNVLVPHPKQNHIVASAAMDKTLFVWNIQRGSCEQTFGRFKPKYPIMTMCFSGPTLFVGFDSTDDAKEKSKILGMDISSGKRVVKMREQYGTICSMSTNQDGNLLLSAAADQTVRLYDVRDNHSSIIFKTLQSDVNKTTFSPCERYIQSSGTNNKTIIFDSRFPSNALHMLEHPFIAGSETQGVLAVEWSSDGLLATSGEDAVIRLWDIRLGKPEIFKLTGHTSIVNCLAFSHDDRMMVSGSSGQQVMLWGLESDPYSISAGRAVNDNAPA